MSGKCEQALKVTQEGETRAVLEGINKDIAKARRSLQEAQKANTISEKLLDYVDVDARKDPQPLEQLSKVYYVELPRALQQDANADKLADAIVDDTQEIDKVLKATTLGRIDELAANLEKTLKVKGPNELDSLKKEVKEVDDEAASVQSYIDGLVAQGVPRSELQEAENMLK